MILFYANNHQFEQQLKKLIKVEIDYIDQHVGILYTSEKNEDILDVFCMNVSSESNSQVTLIKCYSYDAMTRQALISAHRYFPQRLSSLSKVVMSALFKKDQELIDELKKWYNKLNPHLLETVLMVCEQKGNISKTSLKLYIHRNTVANRLNLFEKETGINARNKDNQLLLEMVSLYLSI